MPYLSMLQKPRLKDVEKLSTKELKEELDRLTESFYNGEFTESDLINAQLVVQEMKRRPVKLPAEKAGIKLS